MHHYRLKSNWDDDLIVLRHVVEEGALAPISPLRQHLERLEYFGLVQQAMDQYEATALGKVVALQAPNDNWSDPAVH